MVDRLILVPTSQELVHLRDGFSSIMTDDDVVELCGFGLAVAGTRAAELIARHSPKRVVLLGIAGGYSDVPVGSALEFDTVHCWGIGVGAESVGDESGIGDASFQSAGEMGWPHYDGEEATIADHIDLVEPTVFGRGLLSVASASGTPTQAMLRAASNVGLVAEDMEGFAVAAACKLAKVDLRIIRGISNPAGDRNHNGWKVQDALNAALEFLRNYPSRSFS